jgi:hypothetical protein
MATVIKSFSISPKADEILKIIHNETGQIPSNVVDKLILDKALTLVRVDSIRKKISEVLLKTPKDYEK